MEKPVSSWTIVAPALVVLGLPLGVDAVREHITITSMSAEEALLHPTQVHESKVRRDAEAIQAVAFIACSGIWAVVGRRYSRKQQLHAPEN